MKLTKGLAISLLLILAGEFSSAQMPNIDSLNNYWKNTENPDSLRADALNKFALYHSNDDTALILYSKLKGFSEEINSKLFLAKAVNGIGLRKGSQGKAVECKRDLLKAAEMFKEINHSKGEAGAYINLGSNLFSFNETTKAIYYLKKGLRICEVEKINDYLGNGYNILAGIYYTKENYAISLEYLTQAAELNAANEFENEYYNIISNMGVLHGELGDYHKGIRLHRKALIYWSKLGYVSSVAMQRVKLGNLYLKINDFDSAQINLNEALEFSKENSLLEIQMEALIGLGELNIKLEHYNEAIGLCEKAQLISKKVNSLLGKKGSCKCLYNTHKALGNGTEALHFHELLTNINDSLKKDEDLKRLQQIEFEKLFIKDSLQNVEVIAAEKAQLELLQQSKQRKNRIQYSLVVIVVLLLATLIAVATKFSISPRLASGLIFIFFILLFEFLLVVLDPWVDSVSNGEVGWKIGINTAIALVLFGVHQVSEKRLKKTLIKI